MKTTIKKSKSIPENENVILFYTDDNSSNQLFLSEKEMSYVEEQIKEEKNVISINQLDRFVHVIKVKDEKDKNKHDEDVRMLGDKLHSLVKDEKTIHILIRKQQQKDALLLTEGLALSNYTFTQHKTKPKANKTKTESKTEIQTIQRQNKKQTKTKAKS